MGNHPTQELNESGNFECLGHSNWTICITLSPSSSKNFQTFPPSYWEANSYYPRGLIMGNGESIKPRMEWEWYVSHWQILANGKTYNKGHGHADHLSKQRQFPFLGSPPRKNDNYKINMSLISDKFCEIIPYDIQVTPIQWPIKFVCIQNNNYRSW